MTMRENALAVLRYEKHDDFPLVHFGWWPETLVKWYEEGHITKEEAYGYSDGNDFDKSITKKLGFDFNWYSVVYCGTGLNPYFERKIIERTPDGYIKALNHEGVIVLEKEGVVSISSEIDHLLKDRASYEEHYKHRLQFDKSKVALDAFDKYMTTEGRQTPVGLFCGSLFGDIRNWIGVEGVSYLYVDDEDLYCEIIDTVGKLSYESVKFALESGAKFDFAHFWEDICFKNGPLVVPSVFDELVGPHYKKITTLLNSYGIDIISLDCDGLIDSLIPTWINNGVNTMFPMEVGTWDANIKPWREKYGKGLRGIGGMNKTVFAQDFTAIDKEIERLKPLVELGGYIPCPDHRMAPDSKWENVQYYCKQYRKAFK